VSGGGTPPAAPALADRPVAVLSASEEEGVDAVSQQDFDAQVLKAPGKVVVDFWAEWCGPCRMVAPVLEELARDHSGIRFVKLNVDNDPAIAQQYEVMSIPTILAFEGGQVCKRVVGALPKPKLIEELTGFLG
jgi:thioredoxin 1